MKRTCDNCGAQVPEQTTMYSIRIELFARVEPLVITPKDLLEDSIDELEELVKQMEQLDPEEAEDEVHEQYIFDLCPECRRTMHRQLKLKAPKKDPLTNP